MEEINKLYEQLDSCDNWLEKLELIKNIKELIEIEENKINDLSLTIDNIKKVSKKKINLDNLIEEFHNTNDIEKKIQIYQIMNSYYNKINLELFSN